MEEFKRILGDKADKYTEEELKEVRDAQHQLIEIIIAKMRQDRKDGKI